MNTKFTATSSELDRRTAMDHFNFLVDKSISQEEMIQRYCQTSDQYEKMYDTIVYNGASQTAIMLAELFPSNRENIAILDVAAGTGLCGVEYFKKGFRKMDALDASKEMLEKAKTKRLYGRFMHEILGDGKLHIEDDTYDVVTICNLCIDIMRKLPAKCLEELIRVVKSGGYIINTNYYTTFQEGHERTAEFRQKLRLLESQRKWKQIEVRHFPAYQFGLDGGVSVHKICWK